MSLFIGSALDVTVILTLALAAASALARGSAATRHCVLASALVIAALVPALELAIPQVPVIQLQEESGSMSSGLTFTSGEARTMPVDVVAVTDAPPIPWPTILVAGWAIGMLVVGAGLVIGLARLALIRARCIPVRRGRWREIADELGAGRGLWHEVEIVRSTDPSLLVSCGLARPTIILPAGADSWTDDRCRIVLAHELAHIRRHDGAMQLAAEIVRAVHWFNPLVWICCRRLRHESELACDDAVLNGGTDPAAYASHLLAVATLAAGHHRRWASAPAIAHPSLLERRIAAMLIEKRNHAPLTRRALLMTLAIAVSVAVPLAAAGIAPASTDDYGAPAAQGDVALASKPAAPVTTPAVPSSNVTAPAAKPAVAAPAAPTPATVPRRPVAPARAAAAAIARQQTSTLSGTVLDESGGSLPGARLTLRGVEDGSTRTAVSDWSGRFTFRDILEGRYEIVATLPGFTSISRMVTVAAEAGSWVPVILPLGSVEETVTVVCSSGAAINPLPAYLPSRPQRDATVRHGWGLVWTRALEALAPVASAQQPEPGVPVPMGGNVLPPRKLRDVRPVCPSAAIPGGETTVALVGRIGVDGGMSSVMPIATGIAPSPTPPAPFVDAAIAAVRGWVFTPTMLNGQPVVTTMTIRILFRVTRG